MQHGFSETPHFRSPRVKPIQTKKVQLDEKSHGLNGRVVQNNHIAELEGPCHDFRGRSPPARPGSILAKPCLSYRSTRQLLYYIPVYSKNGITHSTRYFTAAKPSCASVFIHAHECELKGLTSHHMDQSLPQPDIDTAID